MRAAIYARVSSTAQRERDTIASQLRVLPEYVDLLAAVTAKVIGTIRLLMECVAAGHLTSAAAFAACVRMARAGAFLPKMTQQAFDPPL